MMEIIKGIIFWSVVSLLLLGFFSIILYGEFVVYPEIEENCEDQGGEYVYPSTCLMKIGDVYMKCDSYKVKDGRRMVC